MTMDQADLINELRAMRDEAERERDLAYNEMQILVYGQIIRSLNEALELLYTPARAPEKALDTMDPLERSVAVLNEVIASMDRKKKTPRPQAATPAGEKRLVECLSSARDGYIELDPRSWTELTNSPIKFFPPKDPKKKASDD